MSNSNVLYALTATFTSPDDIIRAAENVRDAGFKKFDVHTPYPVHGMDDAMGIKETKLGFVTLVAGILGAIGMILFIYWISAIDYPQVIGGKPYWSWPAFIPITYEITVLLSVLVTVGAMIAVFFKFPNVSHPLHDTSFMKKVSSDKLGISVQAVDAKYDEKLLREIFKKNHAESVEPVYYTEEFISFKPRMFDPKFLLLLAGVAIVSSASGYISWNKLAFMVPYDWMMEQDRINPQSVDTFYEDGFGMRMPVEGTVARGFMPYPYKGKPDDAGKYLVNPLLPTKETLELGKKKFLTFCSPCHGNFGDGDSRLNGQFPNPPTLHSDKVRNWPDGNIYHVITDGQNVMPSYQYQISREERWAIVHYIRALQRSQHAKETDLP